MIIRIAAKFFSFVFMFLFGTVFFNLYYVNEKLQMIQAVNQFHNGQIENDKKLMDSLLADDFIEFGVRRFVQTPEAIYKSNLMGFDYSKVNIKSIEANYLIPLNMFSNSNMSISFVKKTTIILESNNAEDSWSFYVTYTFEKCSDGLKISKVERKL